VQAADVAHRDVVALRSDRGEVARGAVVERDRTEHRHERGKKNHED